MLLHKMRGLTSILTFNIHIQTHLKYLWIQLSVVRCDGLTMLILSFFYDTVIHLNKRLNAQGKMSNTGNHS